MKGKLIIISAPSGSGKTAIVRRLLTLDLNLAFSISATSRKPRNSEIDGKDYYFISPEDFSNRIKRGDFIEWEEVYSNQYYGTLKSEVERLHNQGKHVVFDIDVIGGLRLKEKYRDHALALFIKAPSLEIMEERLRKRATETEEQLKKRIGKAIKEMQFANSFDHIIVNDTLKNAIEEADKLVREYIVQT